MKRPGKLFIPLLFLFVFLFIVSNAVFTSLIKERSDKAVIYMNRFFQCLEEQAEDSDPEHMEELINTLYHDSTLLAEARSEGVSLPDRIYYLPAEGKNRDLSLLNRGNENVKIWTLYREDRVTGFVCFEYRDPGYGKLRILMNLCLAAAFLITLAVWIYIHAAVLRPFGKLAAYPEKMSRNELSEKLPETKNRLFGRFVWGINMLSDRLEKNKKRINELSRDHLTMMTTIAHGIKTPVANIKLYADAIRTGLYQPDGKANEKDAEVAEKIGKNADDVAELVKELIEKASGGVIDFEPEISSFYLNELETFLNEEFSNRLQMLRIPFTVETGHNALVKSDKSGICRILSQLMENAIKYGNGEGISVSLEKDNDGYCFIVKNKGNVPGEKELPYLFNSFWRGSNASAVPGSGIGLFEAREIARKLYGDIYVKADPDAGEIEFDVFIPPERDPSL
ncbi:MAG: HAMP domain-containing histidine kinase [Lachnospiraceae bacterium]|nr:HAMP domain-containing histidine kinase [Lachnospiraceae bacterium]